MSLWKIGADDVSEEAQAIKDRLASKDSQISSHQTQLARQAQELEELRTTLNDTIHKLAKESERALCLEKDLSQCSEDLRNEKVLSQNIRTTLDVTEQKLAAKDLHARELDSIVQTISNESTLRNIRIKELEVEKTTLKNRVQELEIRTPTLQPPTITQPRPSTVANLQEIAGLERELTETRQRLAGREHDLQESKKRLSDAQAATAKVENEKIALQRRLQSRISELESTLAEKTEELESLGGNEEGFRREEELMKRIEEDEAKIAALESMCRNSNDTSDMKRRLQQTEQDLQNERLKLTMAEASRNTLAEEKQSLQKELKDVSYRLNLLENRRQSIQQNATSLNNDADVEMDPPDISPELPENVIAYIERILLAIDRLRDDRDDLRGHIEFLETESKFGIEALEAQIASKTKELEIAKAQVQTNATNEGNTSSKEAGALEAKHLDVVAMVSAITAGRLYEHIESLDQRLADALTSNQHMREQVVKAVAVAEEKINELEQQLGGTTASLEDISRERDSLKAHLESMRHEAEQMKLADLEKRDALEQLQQQLHQVTNQLSDVESERDSLNVQATNLLTDLTNAQAELESAESHYSSLQFQQLSDMTSNQATRALREQIEQLEMRVMRRTEQIGIHQHDIRRLETNLRLQEERLGEMTVELETLSAQKDAMVEDCADAREARDLALARVDVVEDELESAENRRQVSDHALEQMVAVYFEAVASSKAVVRNLNDRIQVGIRTFDQLQVGYGNAQHLLLQSRDTVASLQHMMDVAHNDQHQAVVALSVSQLGLKKSMSALHQLQNKHMEVVSRLDNANAELEQKGLQITELSQQIQALREMSSSSSSELLAQTSKLETEVFELRNTISLQDNKYKEAMDAASSQTVRLKAELEQYEDLAQRHTETEKELGSLKAQRESDIENIQNQLQDSLHTIEALRTQLADAEAEHEKSISNATKSQEELKEQLEAALSDSEDYQRLQKELSSAEKLHSEEILKLQTALDKTNAENNNLVSTLSEAQSSRQEIEDTLTKLTEEHKSALAQVEEEFNATRKTLEESTAQLKAQSEDLSQELENARSETERLTRILEEETRGRTADSEESAKEIELWKAKCDETQQELTTLKEDIAALHSKVEELELLSTSVGEERLSTQEELTAKDAEIQKLASLQRFLESQAQESANTIKTLNAELEKVRVDLAQSEKSAKAAEVNLSLQVVQHRREMADIQRECDALQSRPNLEQALTDLEERNSEMEELLRAKCMEIEENDDRTLEMLKENKKLTAKVETLSRKVQNLQAKLAAAKAALPATSAASSGSKHSPTEPIPDVKSPIFSGPARPTLHSFDIPRDHSVSHAPRAKTPERRILPVPVFKAKTPEKPRMIVDSDVAELSVAIGKKRRAPDDFDAYDSVPAQAFTADSIPRDENNKTPRIKRALSNLQSSFTPVRHQISRPIISLSPKRPSVISDVTNSPHGGADAAKTSKRSWLGKIRGTSSQTFNAPGREG